MTRWSEGSPVIYWEEPVEAPRGTSAVLDLRRVAPGITVATPMLPAALVGSARIASLRLMLDMLLESIEAAPILWYYTPMMLEFSDHIEARCVIYDCMDELSVFRFAPPELPRLERQLLAAADLVFTGGWSLYEAKRERHPNVHAFPSSVDVAHFARARMPGADPADQAGLPRPRLGFYGVIDERMDLALVEAVADARPAWTLVMVGPVAKIDAASLPQRPNIAWLGPKTYDELPDYLGGWDVALMPFAINEATRFISPTKTPEYLAAGLPVVSTPVVDVVRQYGDLDALGIAGDADAFVAACEAALRQHAGSGLAWRAQADALMADCSWDSVHARMQAHVTGLASRPRRRGALLPHTLPEAAD